MNISSDPEMAENMQQKVATFTLSEDQMMAIIQREIDLKISKGMLETVGRGLQ